MGLSFKDVAEILKIIDASECEEVVLELEGTRLVVRRGRNSGDIEKAVTHSPASVNPESSTTSSASNLNSKAAAAVSDSPKTGGSTVYAPMVGTFFRKPSPEAPPFIKEGDSVKIGDPLCLIEVMKLYTTIESSVEGVVEKILANDGDLVEFDQPLFIIRDG
ncbi:MAG: acetyl-CoA carboxylase, biotin carboxyl carrier protein [Magnetovibrio sp.]|nr:acetyl-CoA carboxylase, biotin carboxyl carrier protein [Magnetovibrio sp.]